MMTSQSGTSPEWEVTSHLPSISVPLAKESLRSVASARSNASDERSERPSFDEVVIVTVGATGGIADYDHRRPCHPLAVLRI